jgi:UDP-glucose:(glucosyl)LPS alpha-1,2-glucosyltransferase
MKNNYDLIEFNELSKDSNGGSELMLRRIYDGSVPRELLEKVQIVPSRIRELDANRYRIFLANDLPHDPESKFLAQGGMDHFHKLVFVSHWQRDQYINAYNLPYSKCVVMHNAIETRKFSDAKKEGPIRLIYHTTPHRGLDILYYVFDQLTKKHDDIHLDVYSSFKIYGWESRDEEDHIKKILDHVKNHPKITYHGFKPNDEVVKALCKSDIFAYPSTWPETYCLSLVEAMVAGNICVHPNFAALPEISANWTVMYDMNEDKKEHCRIFYNMLETAISLAKEARANSASSINARLNGQKSYVKLFHNWDIRKLQWIELLNSITRMPLEVPKQVEFFEYSS